LTAEIDARTERALIGRRAPISSSVLKVAHHGSRTSTSQPFLDALRPRAAVISAGLQNPFGHPHPDRLVRLETALGPANIYQTAAGTVEFTTDGSRLRVRPGV
jgi:competence protein ComEC